MVDRRLIGYLYAFGRRAELAAFVDGKAPAEIVCEAFELHGVLDRLVDFHERRLRAEAKRAPPRPLRPLRQA
jgi:hypothetical protein